MIDFQALSDTEVLVLGSDRKLWLEHGPFGKVPPPRQQIDGNVALGPPTMASFVAWHGKTLDQHLALRNQYYPEGFRFISLSIYGPTNAPVYAAVMLQTTNPVTQHDFPSMTADEWQQTFDAQAAQGYGPIILAATGSASNPAFAAVFTPQSPIPLARHGLTGGPALDGNNNPIQTSLGGMNAFAQSQGLILSWAASYGTTSDPAFAGIWVQNSKNTLWNCDGLLEDATAYQDRFNAQTSVWCRPSFVTLNTDDDYMSLIVANETGPWVAHHNMSPSDYQNYFNQLTAQNYYPVCVQAAGSDANSAHFAAIFVQTQSITPQSFTATGPVANAAIDAEVESVLRAYPVARQASLAIVNGTKLVYARAYSELAPHAAWYHTYSRLHRARRRPTARRIALPGGRYRRGRADGAASGQ